MTDTVNATQTNNKPKYLTPVRKGALIGGGIGAVIQGTLLYAFRPSKFILSKDQFEKMIGADDPNLKNISGNIEANYKEYLETASEAVKQFKKQIPATVFKTAAFVGGIGAGIGLIVSLVKKAKAKAQQKVK